MAIQAKSQRNKNTFLKENLLGLFNACASCRSSSVPLTIRHGSASLRQTAGIMPFEFFVLMPCIVIIISSLMMRPGIMTWISLTLAALSLSTAIFFLHHGLVQSCQINESECNGAIATAYIVGSLWIMFSVGLVVRLTSVRRNKGSNTLRAHLLGSGAINQLPANLRKVPYLDRQVFLPGHANLHLLEHTEISASF